MLLIAKKELISEKSLSPKIFDQATAFLLTACCVALHKAQSLHSLKELVTWIPMVLVVAWVIIDLDEQPSSTWRLLIFFLQGTVADCTLSSLVSQKELNSGYPAIMSFDLAI